MPVKHQYVDVNNFDKKVQDFLAIDKVNQTGLQQTQLFFSLTKPTTLYNGKKIFRIKYSYFHAYLILSKYIASSRHILCLLPCVLEPS